MKQGSDGLVMSKMALIGDVQMKCSDWKHVGSVLIMVRCTLCIIQHRWAPKVIRSLISRLTTIILTEIRNSNLI